MSDDLAQRVREWLNSHQPEPLKCIYCGEPQSAFPMCSASAWVTDCATSPSKTHTYEITIGGGNTFEIERIVAFVRAELEAAAQMLENSTDVISTKAAARMMRERQR